MSIQVLTLAGATIGDSNMSSTLNSIHQERTSAATTPLLSPSIYAAESHSTGVNAPHSPLLQSAAMAARNVRDLAQLRSYSINSNKNYSTSSSASVMNNRDAGLLTRVGQDHHSQQQQHQASSAAGAAPSHQNSNQSILGIVSHLRAARTAQQQLEQRLDLEALLRAKAMDNSFDQAIRRAAYGLSTLGGGSHHFLNPHHHSSLLQLCALSLPSRSSLSTHRTDSARLAVAAASLGDPRFLFQHLAAARNNVAGSASSCGSIPLGPMAKDDSSASAVGIVPGSPPTKPKIGAPLASTALKDLVSVAPDSSTLHPPVTAHQSEQQQRRKTTCLFMDCDEESLSEYQCLIRQQMELFEATDQEALSSVQGRNKPIQKGQVGIRCRHCCNAFIGSASSSATSSSKNSFIHTSKGSLYFPTKLDRIYQAAQNLSSFHLCGNCPSVPTIIRNRILVLRERKSPAGGGKSYWAEGVRCLGVIEQGGGLFFKNNNDTGGSK